MMTLQRDIQQLFYNYGLNIDCARVVYAIVNKKKLDYSILMNVDLFFGIIGAHKLRLYHDKKHSYYIKDDDTNTNYYLFA